MRHPIGHSALGGLAAVRTVCGAEPPECPWRAWKDPDVQRVVECWRWADKGQAREAWGDDPEMWLVEGARVFGAALDASRADVLDTEARAREVSRGR